MEKDESLIVEQLRMGNDNAYRHLFKYHYPVLCHFAEGLLRDEFLAETIVGDVIFHLWEIRDDLSITGSRPWLPADRIIMRFQVETGTVLRDPPSSR